MPGRPSGGLRVCKVSEPLARKPVTYVYIDGFNLYYGLKKSCTAVGKSWRWLNLEEFCRRLLSEFDVTEIHYFTARLNPPEWAKAKRQRKFLRALETLPLVTVHYGRYETRPEEFYEVLNPEEDPPYVLGDKRWVLHTEEKQSDVNLATQLLVDGLVEHRFEAAVIASNDSDLLAPIRTLRGRGLTVGILNPHLDRPSTELRDASSFLRSIREKPVYRSQFPDVLSDSGGDFSKPPAW